MKTYFELNINQRINLRSGFDIAIARESGTYNRLSKCVTFTNINENICNNVYNIDRFYVSLRTKRLR